MKLKPLFILLLAFALLVCLHNASTPVFEAPDEVWHHAYVRWLAQGNGLPAMDNDASGANQEVAQPPLYYIVAALFNAPFKHADPNTLIWGNPGFSYQASGTVPDNKNWLIHTTQEAWPWRGAALSIHVTRLASLLFGLLTVAATWGLGYETFGDRRGARVAAMLVAFHPQFVFMCSVISNDSAAAALSTAALWAVARLVRRGLSLRRAVACGLLVGLATLTKTSALLLLPIAGLALLWTGLRRSAGRRPILVCGAAFIAAAILVGGWWYARNGVLYGDLLGISNHTNTPWGRPSPVSLLELWPEMPRLVYSFWAAYGWGHVTWPAWVYWGLTLGALAVFIRSLWLMAHTAQTDQWINNRCETQSSLTMLVVSLLWCGGIVAALLQWMRQVEAPHGRLLFPALGAWALLMANGFRGQGARGKGQEARSKGQGLSPSPALSLSSSLPHSLFTLALFTLTVLAPGVRILATFAPPRLYAPAQVLNKVRSTEIDYARQARLLGVTVDTERAIPGAAFTVKACWQALTPMQRDYTVFVHLIGPKNSRVAERHTYPGLGRFPTSLWPVGRAFCDDYRVPITSWADAPLLYRLEVGLFDAETGARLPATLADGHPFEPPVVGAVSIVSPTVPDAAPTHAVNATFGEHIALRGYDGPAVAVPGETITLTLHWEALHAPDGDFTAFVHLWRPGDSAPLAQHDSSPRAGWYPTTVWQAGDRIPDAHPLAIPADLPPGEYPLWVGWYRATDGIRLPANGPEGHYPHDLVPLGTLSIVSLPPQ